MTILDVETHERDELVHVVLRGELDLSTVGQVEEQLHRVEADRPPLVALDLSQLKFLDSTGLRVVVTAEQRARREGRRLALIRGPDQVQRVFSITRLDERLEIVDNVDALG